MFDGEVFRPETAPDLAPNTRYEITVQSSLPISKASLDALQQLYIFSEVTKVSQYLQQYPFLVEFLEQVNYSIKTFLPETTQLVLTLVEDNQQDLLLEVTIQTEGQKLEVSSGWNQLKEWFFEQLDNLTDLISIEIEHPEVNSREAWAVIESLIGTVEAPKDWSLEHDHYIHGTPKRYQNKVNE